MANQNSLLQRDSFLLECCHVPWRTMHIVGQAHPNRDWQRIYRNMLTCFSDLIVFNINSVPPLLLLFAVNINIKLKSAYLPHTDG